MAVRLLKHSGLNSARSNLLASLKSKYQQKSRGYLDLRFWRSELTVKESHSFVNSAGLPVCAYHDGAFESPWSIKAKGLKTFIEWQMTRKSTVIDFDPKDLPKIGNKTKVPSFHALKKARFQPWKAFIKDTPHVTWIGHATVYYQTDGLYFMTDPLFSDTCSPISAMGPHRFIPPPVEIEDIKVDICLLSHTHYDHMDVPSITRIGNKALWIVPLGVKAMLRKLGVTNCVELNWWESHTVKSPISGKPVEIVFTPTKHWTARTLFDRNTTLWGSFAVLAPSSRFFFTGDTAYCDVFKKIGEMYGPFDLATIPIGAYKPRIFLKDVHCDPSEAVQIHKDLNAKQSCAIHWGTFPLSDEDTLEPALELARSREEQGVTVSQFYSMAHGETVFLGETGHDFAYHNPGLYQSYLKHYHMQENIQKLTT